MGSYQEYMQDLNDHMEEQSQYSREGLRSYYEKQRETGEWTPMPPISVFYDRESVYSKFVDSEDLETVGTVHYAIHGWTQYYLDDTATLEDVALALKEEQGEEDVEETDVEEGQQFRDALNRYAEFTQDFFRAQFGDTIPLYRGINDEELKSMKSGISWVKNIPFIRHLAKQWGEHIDQHVAESWSLDPGTARKFGTYIVRKDIPVDNILGSAATHISFRKEEHEFLVLRPQHTGYQADIIHRPQFNPYENAEWALNKLYND